MNSALCCAKAFLQGLPTVHSGQQGVYMPDEPMSPAERGASVV